MKTKNKVAIAYNPGINYPKFPFSPSIGYPEYIFTDNISTEENRVYAMIRNTLYELGLDKKNFDKKNWNPLSNLVKKGGKIVIKPNFVMHKHPRNLDIFSIITHGSIIRAFVDYAYLAVGDKGKITVCDAPLQIGDFDEIMRVTRLKDLQDYYKNKGIKIDIVDIRSEYIKTDKRGAFLEKIKLKGDPLGYVAVNLGENSELVNLKKYSEKFAVGYYDNDETTEHHNRNFNQYYISRTVLSSDLFINLPKLKTHAKTGVTLSMKNLVGINGQKSWIPHYRKGPPQFNGDEYPEDKQIYRLKSRLTKRLRPHPTLWSLAFYSWRTFNKLLGKEKAGYYKISNGSWKGNDTLWRSILDLNKILLYSNHNGVLKNEKKRSYLSLVDGIISGEENGPLDPTPKKTGILIAGFNPVYVDSTCVKVMGFDINKLKTISCTKNMDKFTLRDEESDDVEIVPKKFENIRLNFNPHSAWKGYLENNTN